MPKEKFLKQVADYYLNKDTDMARTTFVFPNRRSAVFMRSYMQKSLDKLHFMPRMISITYFLQQFDNNALAAPIELIFILYKVYCRVLHKHRPEAVPPDFDKFYFWGSIILNDFNDVDSYMADADMLYLNLKNLKEIKAYYLTPEQIEVIRYLWGDSAAPAEPDTFWAHIEHMGEEGQPSQKYLNLWEVMAELHREFVRELDTRPVPLTYSGLQSRRAAKAIKETSKEDFNGMRYVFVGFNILSTSRVQIFRRLKDLGIADFFWDIASPLISDDTETQSSAGRFVMPLSRKFPMPSDFELQPITSYPEIQIIGVPSNFGQAKVTSSILNEWANEWRATNKSGQIDPARLIDTAVVMADGRLLMPMLYSIEPEIKPINVSMGISYSSTPFAALMSAIISMHLRARKFKDNTWHYYYQDVVNVLQHPHITLIFPDECRALTQRIAKEHIYNVRLDDILAEYPHLDFLFHQIDDAMDMTSVKAYMDCLVDGLRTRLKAKLSPGDDTKYYELSVLDGYADVVDRLCSLTAQYGIVMHERTFLQMIERTLNLTETNFVGEPLQGLQLMDIMDTRTLDFDNLVILSLNERMFPKQNYNPSFIPMSLRRGYHMPTPEYDESGYAYQFYRLISRASRVRLLYDSRTSGVTSGEMSRYLSQLLHLNKEYGIKVKIIEFKAEIEEAKVITVDKTPQVIGELHRFRPGGDLNLSASALKVYLGCPLRFYLQSVRGLKVNDDVMEYIDAASYGTVIHRVAQDLYKPYMGKVITKATIGAMLEQDIELMSLKILDELYYKGRYGSSLAMIPGEGKITARIIAQYVRKMLKKEQEMVPFTFIGAEVGEHIKFPWRINDKYTLNFTMSIDRIDETPAGLRFIDYKTGSDSLSAASVKDIFDKSDNGGIFQLLLYCHAFASKEGYDGPIKPLIYKFQTIPTEGITPLRLSRCDIDDYRQADSGSGEDNFWETFQDVIDRIFEEENTHPFVQTDDVDHCRYCHFAQMCGRYPETNFRL